MKETDTPTDNSRRNLLLGSAAISASLIASNSFAAMDHSQHHNMQNPHSSIINAALSCIKTGDACAAHCIQLIQMGDNTMADCLATVTDMLPMCSTLAKLSASQSSHLSEFAKVCTAICEDCEKACKEHADKHTACKDCMNSCAACIKECKKLLA